MFEFRSSTIESGQSNIQSPLKNKKVKKSSLNYHANVHDKRQLEINFAFPFTANKSTDHQLNVFYQVDAYFYIPQSMGIDIRTYSPDQFYQNILNYQRIHTPEEFKSHTTGQYLIHSLEDYMAERMDVQKFQECSDLIIQEIKIFACSIDAQLKTLGEKIRKLINRDSIDRINVYNLFSKVDHIYKQMEFYRHRYIHNFQDATFEHPIREGLFLIDEYISNRFEYIVLTYERELSNEGTVDLRNFRQQLLSFLHKEVQYQKQSEFLSLDVNANQEDIELYSYRQGLLKKYVFDVLYLQREDRRKEKFYKNLVAMLGAGLAAVWAATAEIQRLRILRNEQTTLNYIPLILIAVFAYIFKDRIKDLSKEFLHKHLRKILPDFKNKLVFSFFNRNGEQETVNIGEVKENISYLNSEQVPKDVQEVRQAGQLSRFYEPDRKESIYHYSKMIYPNYKKVEKMSFPINALKDVWRIDVSDFLSRLDDPKRTMRYFDLQNGTETAKAVKTYHLNLVINCKEVLNSKGKKIYRKTNAYKLRLVLNKKGIMRVEKITP